MPIPSTQVVTSIVFTDGRYRMALTDADGNQFMVPRDVVFSPPFTTVSTMSTPGL